MIVGKGYKKKVSAIWKKWLKVNQSGLNFGRVMANQIFYACHYDNQFSTVSKNKIIKVLAKLLKAVVFTKLETPFHFENTGKSILFFHQEDNRRDYQQQCNYVLDQLVVNYEITEITVDKNKKNKNAIRMKHSFKKIILLFKLFFYTYSSKNYYTSNGIHRNLNFYVISLYYYDYYFRLLEILKDYEIKLLITFCDVKEYANILTQACIRLNVITITQQHALYISVNKNNYSQVVLNYKNLISSYLLAWGKGINKQWKATNFDFSKIVYAGSNLPGHIRSVKVKGISLPLIKKFGVILSAEYWRKTNMEILKIAYQFSIEREYKFEILFHPTNDIGYYRDKLDFIEDKHYFQGINNPDNFIIDKQFLVCNTTSLYLRCLVNNRKCFRFKDENFIDIGGVDEDIFKNLDDLKKLCFDGMFFKNDDYEKINSVLAFHYGNEEMGYEKAIERILKKENISI
ncbi:hypothetical protein [Snuella sedimenti]|uniref:Uncharacterized protein n=1 Tax=Snuella sedimenti TaxID=2798802 RepID=A0A8J7J3R1_9FLAO|nr:hypothetical protein [Snuella sedimenti]MBJ6367898.1 hypothetical protein [Snuella sedimenti]